jgi:hypothetical protein
VTALSLLSLLLGSVTAWAAGVAFAPDGTLTTGTNPFSIAVSDLNGDNKPDLVVANRGEDTVTVYLNTTGPAGPISFDAGVSTNTGDEPASIAIDDLDEDGDRDIAIANAGSGTDSGTVSILRNSGAGVFPNPSVLTLVTGLTQLDSVAAADINLDGRVDLAVTRNAGGQMRTFRNTTTLPGTPTFAATPGSPLTVPAGPTMVLLALIDGDARPDIVVSSFDADAVGVLRTQSAGFDFDALVSFPVGDGPGRPVASDFDGDGKLDVAVVNRNADTVSVLLNTSAGGTVSFATYQTFPAGDEPFDLASADFDQDGKPDLAVANRSSNNLTILRNTSSGVGVIGFDVLLTIPVGSGPQGIVAGLLDDGLRPDLAVANGNANTVTLLRNAGPPGSLQFSAASSTASEGGSAPTIAVTRTDGTTGQVSATVSVLIGGTAATPTDFILATTTVTFNDGDAVPKTVSLTIVDDQIDEDDETVQLRLSATGDGAIIGAQATHTLTVIDNDTANVIVTQSGGATAVTEGGLGDSFDLVLATQPTSDVTISFATGSQLAPIASELFTTANWNTVRTITVAAVDDLVSEGAHSGQIAMTASSADPKYNNFGLASIAVAITDNDTPGFTVSPTAGPTTTEAGGQATFTVRLNTVPTQPVTIALASSDTTEGTVSPASLTFAADATAVNTPQTVTVTGVQDAIVDGSIVYAIVTGAAASGDLAYQGLDPADVAVTNVDDDGAAGLTIGDATVTEGDAGTAALTFTVTLNPPSSQVVTVQFATANGPAPNGATGGAACAAGVDYLTTSGTLTFQPTETSKPIAVTVCADTVTEADETVVVDLSGAVGAAIADGQGQGTITDDDVAGALTFTSATASVPENAGSVALTVQRSGPGIAATGLPAGSAPSGNVPSGSVRPNPAPSPATTTAPVGPAAISAVTVDYTTANGSATAGQDYTATSGTLSFGVGETTKTITIPILSDAIDEQPETFTVTLSAPSGGATLGAISTATATIADVDTTPCQTFLTAAVPAGSNVLPVQSQAGCSVGDTVAIDPGLPNEDRGTILGFGSIVIQQPTTQAHAAGAVVIRVTGAAFPAVPPPSPGDDSADDERVERERETEEERRQRARTNQGNRDDDAVEGDVVETRCDQPWPAVVIANRDGLVEVRLIKEAQAACTAIRVGDYLEADGEKQHEGLFHADSVEVKRRR